jgi:F-type H+-transporting ATPase subunit alpha
LASKSSEIIEILKQEIQGFSPEYKEADYGVVVQVGDNIVRISGLTEVRAGEMLLFENGSYGIIFNLEEYSIGCVILGADREIQEGQHVQRTGKFVQVPVGKELLGRVVNSLGQPLDGKGPINAARFRPIEATAPKVIDREPVNRPLCTGIKAIDALTPIGRGQRELIIGDRQTGKTAIAVDAIISQTPEDVYCIYVAIGQKASSIVSVVETLEKHDRLKNTIVIAASANDPAGMLFVAPYAGCAMAEEFMYSGSDVLIVYDDLTKHANSYRELSLLLHRPPGREAYPGDVFYLHSRLLERSAKLSQALGAGSSTALPIIETQMGDGSAYIPTNVISITDGQIYLDRDLFHQGVRPAVDVGLSVSRVGGAAQTRAMKKVSGTLRLDLSQFREMETFMKISSEGIGKASQMQLARGKRIVEALKQPQFHPLSFPYQIPVLYLIAQGMFDDMPAGNVGPMEEKLHRILREKYPGYEEEVSKSGELTPQAESLIKQAFSDLTEPEGEPSGEGGDSGEAGGEPPAEGGLALGLAGQEKLAGRQQELSDSLDRMTRELNDM